jgi:hypothetical protein
MHHKYFWWCGEVPTIEKCLNKVDTRGAFVQKMLSYRVSHQKTPNNKLRLTRLLFPIPGDQRS